tara:strand:- start:904 stop:1767 length:864 start_codon:yes stop_codon:yes gene_type:complete
LLERHKLAVIIGVSGKKQSGKSSFCNYFQAQKWMMYNRQGEFKFSVNRDGSIAWSRRTLKDAWGPESSRYNPDDWIWEESDPPRNLDDTCKIYSFADSLKQKICIEILGLTYEQCYGTDEQKNSLTEYKWDNLSQGIRMKYSNKSEAQYKLVPMEFGGMERLFDDIKLPRTGFMAAREIMQVVGTDIFRNQFSQMIWVNATLRAIKADKPDVAIIGDVRFKSELQSIADNNGHIVRLLRKVSDDKHSSEIDLDDVDFSTFDKCKVIDNTDMSIYDKNHIAFQFVTSK